MRVPPHNLEAEESVLGAMIRNAQVVDDLSSSLTPSDFYKPLNSSVYASILRLRTSGREIDLVTLGDDLGHSHGKPDEITSYLFKLQTESLGSTAARKHAEIIMQHSARRRLVVEAAELAEQAYDIACDIEETLERHKATISTLGTSIIDHEPDDVSIEEFITRPREKINQWAVHGLIRRGHKLMVVAGEGAGKSWLLRFVAICAAYGINPFRHNREVPIRTLIVDVENPEDALYDSFAMIMKQVIQHYDKEGWAEYGATDRLWWRPEGINLRSRVDLAEFENVIKARKPDLVCLGPLYATYENTSKDFGWEGAAREVQNILKKLMVRYDFALMIEDHAPGGDGGKRDMRPYGSSFWRRWPDIGIGLEEIDDQEGVFKVGRWRGDRVVTDWPKIIKRGSVCNSPWPFVGEWE